LTKFTGLLFALAGAVGAALAVSAVFISRQAQDSLSWRSNAVFNRVSNDQLRLENSLLTMWARGMKSAPTGAIVLLGDSHFHGIPSTALPTNSLNLGIGGLTALRLAQYLQTGQLTLPNSPRGIVLLIGHNDLYMHAKLPELQSGLLTVIGHLSRIAPLHIFELVPPSLAKSQNASQSLLRSNVNRFLRASCESTPQCSWHSLNALKNASGHLAQDQVESDQIHLSVSGYATLIATVVQVTRDIP
jgi:lysophospholipase L1-like esterase